ncbi:MAG TPA: VCBS repeat-containing protein, partial [Chthoniobacterales bacterium]|nr:VCBS repeat-containing protein [Chthoniobacterales bacterium]
MNIRIIGEGSNQIQLSHGNELAPRDIRGPRRGFRPIALASADFDSDGLLDIVTGDTNGALEIYFGNPDRLRPGAGRLKVPVGADFLLTGDFNADGARDIVVVRRGDNSLYLVPGNGAGDFAAAIPIKTGGPITGVEAGEIGRADGQTDLAVAVTESGRGRLLVFEHPEGAFKHAPEAYELPGPAQAIAVGELDGDSFGDIAVGSGSQLTVVHGRGQLYPLDRLPEHGLKRPLAVVETRSLPVSITGLAIGKFAAHRHQSLTVLTGDGTLQAIEPDLQTASRLQSKRPRQSGKPVSLPAGVEPGKFAAGSDTTPNDKAAAEGHGVVMAELKTGP